MIYEGSFDKGYFNRFVTGLKSLFRVFNVNHNLYQRDRNNS